MLVLFFLKKYNRHLSKSIYGIYILYTGSCVNVPKDSESVSYFTVDLAVEDIERHFRRGVEAHLNTFL